jgi:signal transduction histidine kinase
VNADHIKLSQVVYNLINNAITYTGPDKSVTITQSISQDSVKIEIADTGEGIAEESLPLIWDRYYKVDKAHKRAAIGTGLGLSIVKTILDLHEAKYGVSSTVGQGSTFWFQLKLDKTK